LLLRNIAYHLLPDELRGLVRLKTSGTNPVKNIIDSKKLTIDNVHPFDNIPIKYRSVSEISQHYTFYSTLPKYMHWEDRNSMAHSVEVSR
jgi:hypothetical protein